MIIGKDQFIYKKSDAEVEHVLVKYRVLASKRLPASQ